MSAIDYLTQAQALIAQALGELQPAPVNNVVRIKTTDNLQKAIDGAISGTTILVQPGVYDGIILRGRIANISILPDTTNLPVGRIDPSYTSGLIQLRANVGPLPTNIISEPGASGYNLVGFCLIPGRNDVAMVELGSDTTGLVTDQPDNVILDRCLFIADPNNGGKRAINGNCRSFSLINSYGDNFWFSDDAQVFATDNGPGPYLIQNNYMVSSGENIIFGGGDSISPAMMPGNVIIRGNYLTKPLSWMGKAGATIKNSFELKACQHALIENNIMENVWVNGQAGMLLQFTPRNQNGAAIWSGLNDITFQYNLVRNGAGGLSITGVDNNHPSARTNLIKVLNNLFMNFDQVKFGPNGRCLQIIDGPNNFEYAFNTIVNIAGLNSAVNFSGLPCDNLNIHDNVLSEGAYGMIGDDSGVGVPSWNTYTKTSQFNNNLIQRTTTERVVNYPGVGNVVVNGAALDANYKPLPSYGLPNAGVNIDLLKQKLGLTSLN